MKILYCIASFSAQGGTEKVLSTKASYLADHGYEVTILISDQHQKPFAYPLADKIKIIDLKITNKLKGKIKFIGFFQNIKTLKKLYKKEIGRIDPDVVIVLERGYEDFIIPYILKDIPKIREYHSSRKAFDILENKLSLIQKYKRKIVRKVYEYHYRKYNRLVLLTIKDQKNWKDFQNIVVIPNVIKFVETKSNGNVLMRPQNLISVGSMTTDQKGFSALIKIWSKIEERLPDWSLNIYGDGVYRKNYEKAIQELNLKNIILHGLTDQILNKYNESQIFVMTSNGEGLPMVMIEALSQGLPIVAYDCYCGPSDILVNDIGGFLIEFGNEDQFIEKLEKMMVDEQLRLEKSQEAYEVSKKYSVEEIMPMWFKLLNEVVR